MSGVTAIFSVATVALNPALVRLMTEVVCEPDWESLVLLTGKDEELVYASVLIEGVRGHSRVGIVAAAEEVAGAAQRAWTESEVRLITFPLLRIWAPDEREMSLAEDILGQPLEVLWL